MPTCDDLHDISGRMSQNCTLIDCGFLIADTCSSPQTGEACCPKRTLINAQTLSEQVQNFQFEAWQAERKFRNSWDTAALQPSVRRFLRGSMRTFDQVRPSDNAAIE